MKRSDVNELRPAILFLIAALVLFVFANEARSADMVIHCPNDYGSTSYYCGGCSNPVWTAPKPGLTVRSPSFEDWVAFDSLKPDDQISISTTATEGQSAYSGGDNGQCTPTPVTVKVSALNSTPDPTSTPGPTIPYKTSFTCKPTDWKQVYFDIESTRGIGWWHCDQVPINAQFFCANPQNMPKMKGKINLAQLIHLAAIKRPCTAIETQLYAESWDSGNRLKATVYNTTAGATTAPAYFANANGTRNTKEVARVDVDTECNFLHRLVTISSTGVKTGTSYYAVVGKDIGGKWLYANCKLDGQLVPVK